MGFRLFKKKEPSRSELIKDVASELAKNESAPPPDFITELTLANGQTPDRALAEYYALTFSALTYALWASLGTQEKVFPILDVLQPIFVQSLSSDCKRIFLEIATLREQMYIKTIDETLKSADTARAIRLSSSMVARITGHYDERLGMEQLQPDCLDIAVLTGLWKLITDQNCHHYETNE